MGKVGEQAYNWWMLGEKVTFRVPKIRGKKLYITNGMSLSPKK